MKRIASIALALVLVGIACSDPNSEAPAEPLSEATNEASSPPATTEASPEPPEPDPLPPLASLDERIVIPGTANIFAAGRSPFGIISAGPGGGGAGTLPPGWRLPPGSDRVVTFPSVTGRINPWVDYPYKNGPAGDHRHDTDVESLEGISGIVADRNGSFLVGVFLTEERPSDPAPPRLDVSKPPPSDLVTPLIGQVFLIGNGKGYRFAVPRGATRLFLGTADAMLWQGPPGFYGNNSGRFKATIALTKG